MGTELAGYDLFTGFNWFITQVFLGLLPWPNFFAFLIPFVFVLTPLFPQYLFFNLVKVPRLRNRIRLAFLPVIWSSVALYGYLFRDKGPDHSSPPILTDVLIVPFIVFAVLSIYQVVHNDQCRKFVIVLVALNFYFLLTLNNLAFMAITDRWTFADV